MQLHRWVNFGQEELIKLEIINHITHMQEHPVSDAGCLKSQRGKGSVGTLECDIRCVKYRIYTTFKKKKRIFKLMVAPPSGQQRQQTVVYTSDVLDEKD